MGGGSPDTSIQRYLSSVDADYAIIQYDIDGSRAHVMMLLKTGIISKPAARRILRALASIARDKKRLFAPPKPGGMTVYEKTGTDDLHELLEMYVIKRAGMPAGGRLHTGRSRNDQVTLDIRMKIRDDINKICTNLLDAAESMLALAHDNRRTIMPLYTHMQHAQPGLFSHWLLAHTDALLRDYGRLSDAYARINKCPLGSGPVGGTSLPIDRDYTAQLLGFDGLVENSLDATSTRDYAAEYVSAVSIMMSNLSRLAEDLVMWSTVEFSFIELADDISSPSSAMPQKKNPDVLEITRAKAAESAGHASAILAITGGLASGYGRDLQQIKPLVWSVSETGADALLAIHSVMGSIRVDKGRMRRVTESSDLAALDVAEQLVLHHDMPFRQAHAVAAKLSQYARNETKKTIGKLDVSQIKDALAYAYETRTISIPDPKDIMKITSSLGAVSSLRNRISKGSSGYAEQKRMIAGRRRALAKHRQNLDERKTRINGVLSSLRRTANRF